MKVIVRCPKNRVTKSEMEQIIESLFQENKDLRVQVGHLRDELANAKTSVEIQRGFREEMAEEIEALEKELAKSESESSQGMNAMVKFWEEAVNEKNKAEERAEKYRIALMESDCRVAELEKQLEWARNTIEEMKAQKEADDKKCKETCTACNEQYENVLAERNRLRDALEEAENLRLDAEKERDMYRSAAEAWHTEHDKVVAFADKRKEKLDEAMRTITCLNNDIHELEETIDGINEEKRMFGEEIDRLRKVVIELQSNRSLTNEIHEMLYKYLTTVNTPSADK